MEISREKTAWIGFGVAAGTDPFQAGREAAQIAKNQIPDGPPDLALAVAPDDARFKPFVEGVRLVTGETSLIGVPCPWVLAADSASPQARAVLLVHSSGARVTVVSSVEDSQPLRAVTSIFSALRAVRGNVRRDFDFHGIVAIKTGLVDPRGSAAEQIAADAGLESWVAGWTPSFAAGSAILCGGREMTAGIAAVEWLSEQPWGVGSVDLSAFHPNQDALREAVRASVRAAEKNLRGLRPAAGLIVMSAKNGPIAAAAARDAFLGATSALPKIPILGLPARSAFARAHDSTLATSEDSVTCLLVPE